MLCAALRQHEHKSGIHDAALRENLRAPALLQFFQHVRGIGPFDSASMVVRQFESDLLPYFWALCEPP
jgi:hypothetical protein